MTGTTAGALETKLKYARAQFKFYAKRWVKHKDLNDKAQYEKYLKEIQVFKKQLEEINAIAKPVRHFKPK